MASKSEMEPSKGMKFARKLMEGLGWKEGSGLGLNQDGITEAIKPSAKFDLSGIGHKVFNDFQWWDHAFNRAASSFDVKVNQDEVTVEKVGTNSTGKIKTKKNIFVEPESLAYGTFCKTGTLNNGVMEEKITSTVLKEEKDFSLKISDEELFKMCNGLTAHKGARHGLTASGKLARIAQQEALMMASYAQDTSSVKKDQEKKKEKSKKKRTKNPALEQTEDIPHESQDVAESRTTDDMPARKTKRKSKNQTIEDEENPDEGNVKSRKRVQESVDSPTIPLESEDQQPSKKRKKSKKDKKSKQDLTD